jgi:hypothetical protein
MKNEEILPAPWKTIYSTRGNPIGVLTLMPRIDDRLIDSVIYLYPSVEAAEEGEPSGGTGFLVSVELEHHPGHFCLYAITNAHVIKEAQSPVIRLNTTDGRIEIIPLDVNQWKLHPEGDDLAAVQLAGINTKSHKFVCIPSSLFITPEVLVALKIGLGDEIYMVGRFVRREGRVQNKPAIRSGIIAMMADKNDGVEFCGEGLTQEAFLVEMHSTRGFSGSPVLFRMPLRDFESMRAYRYLQPEAENFAPGPWLVGINAGIYTVDDKVYMVDKTGKLVETDYLVKSHSGYSVVIPAWRLEKLLNAQEFADERERLDKKQSALKRKNPIELHDSQRPQ